MHKHTVAGALEIGSLRPPLDDTSMQAVGLYKFMDYLALVASCCQGFKVVFFRQKDLSLHKIRIYFKRKVNALTVNRLIISHSTPECNRKIQKNHIFFKEKHGFSISRAIQKSGVYFLLAEERL